MEEKNRFFLYWQVNIQQSWLFMAQQKLSGLCRGHTHTHTDTQSPSQWASCTQILYNWAIGRGGTHFPWMRRGGGVRICLGLIWCEALFIVAFYYVPIGNIVVEKVAQLSKWQEIQMLAAKLGRGREFIQGDNGGTAGSKEKWTNTHTHTQKHSRCTRCEIAPTVCRIKVKQDICAQTLQELGCQSNSWDGIFQSHSVRSRQAEWDTPAAIQFSFDWYSHACGGPAD